MREGFHDFGVEAFLDYVKSLSWVNLVIKGQKFKRCTSCGTAKYVERGVDVGMITAAIKEAHKDSYDCLIMINGDGDLYDGISYIKELGKEYIPLTEKESTSVILEELALFHMDIRKITEHYNNLFGYTTV
jgi:uncharacterized LabA/DUF88 family protein